jgi:hypothetical protein
MAGRSGLASSGGGAFSLVDIHQRNDGYDQDDTFDFRNPSPGQRADPMIYSLPPTVSNGKLQWKKPAMGGSASTPGLQSGGLSRAPSANSRSRTPNLAPPPSGGDAPAASSIDTELSHAAVQSLNNTWQYVGRVEAPFERPAMRNDILKLEDNFDSAMEHVDKGQDDAQGTGVTVMDRDLMNIRGQVDSQYLNQTDKQKEDLTACIYEQKWTDLVLGEMEDQLLVSCLEQGRLLRKLRARCAKIFGRQQELHNSCVQQLAGNMQQVEIYKHNMAELEEKQQHMEQRLTTAHTEQMDKMLQELEDERAECKRQTADANSQVVKMSETLKFLNSIFKEMRKDTEQMRFADLRDAYSRLEAQVEEKNTELQKLRPLVSENEKLAMECKVQKMQLNDFTARTQALEMELVLKEKMCEELMARESERLSAQELRDQEEEEEEEGALGEEKKSLKKKRVEEEEPDELKKYEEVDGETLQDIADTFGFGVGGLRMVNMRCNKALDAITDTSDLQKSKTEKKKRLPCTGYRLLLPNLMGYRPSREPGWVMCCMRSLVRGKMVSDTEATREGRLRERMPEFVYSWFEPRDEALLPMSTEQREAAVAQADEDRWALYYGVKALAKALPEAKLWYNLLDERFGEDELVFYNHCLRVINNVSGGLMWGPRATLTDFAAVTAAIEASEGPHTEPELIWVDVRFAGTATEHVMSNASTEDRAVVLKRTASRALDAHGKLPAEQATRANGETAKCVDLYSWLSVMCKEHREEQAHRRAAVRLMFNTASSGALTSAVDGKGKHKPGNGLEDGEGAPGEGGGGGGADMQQFCAMVLTLNASASTGTVARLFRDAFDLGDGRVTYESFMQAAELHQFFTSCLRLPTFLGAEHVSELEQADQDKIGAAVHFHEKAFRPAIENAAAKLPMDVRGRFDGLRRDLALALRAGGRSRDDTRAEGAKTNPNIDGRAALCAYRRVLDVMLHRRMVAREDRGEPGAAAGGPWPDKVVRTELAGIEAILGDWVPAGPTAGFWRKIRPEFGVIRIQRAWRARLRNQTGLPVAPWRKWLLPGYGSGKSGLRKRHAMRPASLSVTFITVLYHDKMVDDEQRRKFKLGPTDMPTFLYEWFSRRFGARALAERHLHDFLVNVRSHSKSSLRCRTFALLCGAGQTKLEQQTFELGPTVVRFVLKTLSFISQLVDSMGGGGSGVRQLFPQTEQQYRETLDKGEFKSTVTEQVVERTVVELLGGQNPRLAEVKERIKMSAKIPMEDAFAVDKLISVFADELRAEQVLRAAELQTALKPWFDQATATRMSLEAFVAILKKVRRQSRQSGRRAGLVAVLWLLPAAAWSRSRQPARRASLDSIVY